MSASAALSILEVVVFFGLLAVLTGGTVVAVKLALSVIGRSK